ncbi:MAG: tRNA (adenosine(37)-N6)-threonylcarbamoyltransferase complex ATPase subunit type 1 TsaE [Deltaproteobacteria bacterium]|nr:tRNA (adenosine(37)-N6)-threonylcarbamoyltransferase complex ATPase subunit type 1 TsaE [Deltaproteobacteria bacterium]
MRLEIESRSPEQTFRLGCALGRLLTGGEVLGLSGELGAGKTQLVRGLAQGLDIDPDVIYSPSFTLVAEHDGRLRLNHIDLFRLGERVEQSDEEEIGLTEYLVPAGVTVIEWYRKLDKPPAAWSLEIDLAVHEGERRTITLEGRGERAARMLDALARDSTWH